MSRRIARLSVRFRVEFYSNIYTGNIENRIEGANLTWVGDDITTAVYSHDSQVFDFKNNVIGFMDAGVEIQSLELNADGSRVVAKDFEGNKSTFEVEIGDTAMYRYADFLRKWDAKSWDAFISETPKNTIAYVMECPPTIVKSVLPFAENGDAGGEECIYVVSLKDDTYMHLDFGSYDFELDKFMTDRTELHKKMAKGESFGYMMMIPEGMPNACVYAAQGTKGGMFPVEPISGQTDLCSKFRVDIRILL